MKTRNEQINEITRKAERLHRRMAKATDPDRKLKAKVEANLAKLQGERKRVKIFIEIPGDSPMYETLNGESATKEDVLTPVADQLNVIVINEETGRELRKLLK